MMSHLDPSVELTGGPWYSENELDTEFINALTGAILRFIQDKVNDLMDAIVVVSYPAELSQNTQNGYANCRPTLSHFTLIFLSHCQNDSRLAT